MGELVGSPSVPAVRLMDERVGKRIGLFDRMTSKSLGVVKAIDIAGLCPNRRGSNHTVRLEYTESGDGISVVFRDDTPGERRPWVGFATALDRVVAEQSRGGFVYCAKQIGLTPAELTQIIIDNAPHKTGTMSALVVPSNIGPHRQVRDSGPDIHGRSMIFCGVCHVCAHSEEDLEKTACNPTCRNCEALRHSYDGKPAVPIGGSSNSKTHICPNDGNRWWQTNNHLHLWQQVTNDREWQSICNPEPDWD